MLTPVKISKSRSPIDVAAVTIETLMMPAMRAYSIAVAPEASFWNRFKRLDTTPSPLLKQHRLGPAMPSLRQGL